MTKAQLEAKVAELERRVNWLTEQLKDAQSFRPMWQKPEPLDVEYHFVTRG